MLVSYKICILFTDSINNTKHVKIFVLLDHTIHTNALPSKYRIFITLKGKFRSFAFKVNI